MMSGEKSAPAPSPPRTTKAPEMVLPEWRISACILPQTRLQRVLRHCSTALLAATTIAYTLATFLVWRRVSAVCIAFLMTWLTIVWLLVGVRASLRFMAFYAKLALSLMLISTGMLVLVPCHVASYEVAKSGDYHQGVRNGMRIALSIFFFVAAQPAEISTSSNLNIIAVNGLASLQHRGTESSGLVGSDGVSRDHVEIIKGHGLVRDVITEENISKLEQSNVIIGHNRYSTAGKKKSGINCVQPFVVYTTIGTVAIAHNGELVDARKKRKEVLHEGVGLSTDTDSELIAQMIAKAIALNVKCHATDNGHDLGDVTRELAVTMSSLNMSYSLLVMTFDRLYAIRDPFGNRPLCVGTVLDPKGAPIAYCASSESCALPANSRFEFEVRPGEIVELSQNGGIKSVWQMKPSNPQAMCIFEYVYFARNDSEIEGQQVEEVREECGRTMALEDGLEADLVGNVPDSSLSAAIGYAAESRIPYEPCLHRNSYVGRSFIQPNDEMRQHAIKMKFGVLKKKVENKRVVLVDDSIVRGNTMKTLVKMLREAGAKEVHLRIASPPVKFPCFMGINIPTSLELIAAQKTIPEICEFVGADSVRYLSVDGLVSSVQKGIEKAKNFTTGHCTACLTGKYPVPIDF